MTHMLQLRKSPFSINHKKTQIFWKKERIFSHKTVLTIHIAPLYRNLYCIGKKLSIPSPSLYSISIRCWFVKTKIWNKDIYFLVDTGSSLISNEIFDSLLGNKDLLDLQTILTADGDLLSVKGKTDVDLCLNKMECSTTLVVAQYIHHSLVRLAWSKRTIYRVHVHASTWLRQ